MKVCWWLHRTIPADVVGGRVSPDGPSLERLREGPCRPLHNPSFFADVKDVLFQSDCFKYLEGDQFQLFTEGIMKESRLDGSMDP